MWDAEPVLYWRLRQGGKLNWKKANAARYRTSEGMIVWVIEPPVPKVNESEGESDES